MLKITGEQAAKLLARTSGDRLAAGDLQAVLGSRTAAAVTAPSEPPPARRSKYGAERVVCDGITFDSGHERDVYLHLRARGALFLRQTPMHLPGEVTYRADFLEILDPEAVRIIDAKGAITPMYATKRRMVEAMYAPLRILEVTRETLRAGVLS